MASHPLDDEAVAAADKEMEERANRAKELLANRYHGLKSHQVTIWTGRSFSVCMRLVSPHCLR